MARVTSLERADDVDVEAAVADDLKERARVVDRRVGGVG
jgi:hypothetical protein